MVTPNSFTAIALFAEIQLADCLIIFRERHHCLVTHIAKAARRRVIYKIIKLAKELAEESFRLSCNNGVS